MTLGAAYLILQRFFYGKCQAYKHLRADTLSDRALEYAQKHLWITCFLYGLLRPMDGIVPYRMEHCVALETTNDKPINQFWKDQLTKVLIRSVQADDGILMHLSTEEYEHLFEWKRVCKEVTVVQASLLRPSEGRQTEDAGCMGKVVPWSNVPLHSEQPHRRSRRTLSFQLRRL